MATSKKVSKGSLKSASGRGDSKLTRVKVSGKAEAINVGKINAATGNTTSKGGKKEEISKKDIGRVAGTGPSRTKLSTHSSTPVDSGQGNKNLSSAGATGF